VWRRRLRGPECVGDAPEERRVYERNERDKCFKVGAFTPARSRTVGRPWWSTGRRSWRQKGTRRSRPMAFKRTYADSGENTRGSQMPCLYPPCARALRQSRGKGPRQRGKRVGGVRCTGENGAQGSTLPPKRCAWVHGHTGVHESARMRMPESRPWRGPRQPGRLTRERKQGRKASRFVHAVTTVAAPARKLSQPGSMAGITQRKRSSAAADMATLASARRSGFTEGRRDLSSPQWPRADAQASVKRWSTR
jgi:hypothetical protein